MNTLVARLTQKIRMIFKGTRVQRTLVGEQELLIAKGREQFERLLDKGLSLPIATI